MPANWKLVLALAALAVAIIFTALADAAAKKPKRPRPLNRRVLSEKVLALEAELVRMNEWRERYVCINNIAKRLDHLEWQMGLILPSCDSTNDTWHAICATWPPDPMILREE